MKFSDLIEYNSELRKVYYELNQAKQMSPFIAPNCIDGCRQHKPFTKSTRFKKHLIDYHSDEYLILLK